MGDAPHWDLPQERTRRTGSRITLDLATAYPVGQAEPDLEAARQAVGLGTRLYLDPVVHGQYPADVVANLAAIAVELPEGGYGWWQA